MPWESINLQRINTDAYSSFKVEPYRVVVKEAIYDTRTVSAITHESFLLFFSKPIEIKKKHKILISPSEKEYRYKVVGILIHPRVKSEIHKNPIYKSYPGPDGNYHSQYAGNNTTVCVSYEYEDIIVDDIKNEVEANLLLNDMLKNK